MDACQSLYILTQDVFFCGAEIEGVIFETFKWDYIFVAISIAICIAYSSIACEMYARNLSSQHSNLKNIIKTGSIYGLGIFSMHFMGMFALVYPGPMQYDAVITIFSLFVAISGVNLTLYLMHKDSPLFLSGSIFGITVCMMHYAGMLSIANNPFHMHHNLNYMIMALVYAIIGSMLSIKFIQQHLRKGHEHKKRVLLLGSTAMGLTISGVHYLAMAALEFSVISDLNEFPHSWFIHRNIIIASTFILLISTIAIYTKDSIKSETKIKASKEDLENKNNNLTDALEKLKEMQSHLVESEKMASLGQLVSGVAHEINTPIGICITSSSYLKDKANMFFNKFKDGSITKSDFEKFMEDVDSGSDLISSNLIKASSLVKNFKQVAVDQSADEIREFQIEKYIRDVLSSLHHKIKNTQFQVNVICENDFHVKTYPGSISVIINHLFNNSLIHGLENMTEGHITIEIQDLGDSAKITMSDSGCGMSAENIKNITRPFYTTKRGGDCSGLGMYIVYNQATQKLLGSLQCHSLNALSLEPISDETNSDSPHGLIVEICFPKCL